MPNQNDDVRREHALEILKDFPAVLEPHTDLVQTLAERYKTKKALRPTKFIKNWEEHNNSEKFFFLGWLRAAIKRMGVVQAMMYINLKEKQDIDFALAIILDGATEEELQAFREGEDAISLHK